MVHVGASNEKLCSLVKLCFLGQMECYNPHLIGWRAGCFCRIIRGGAVRPNRRKPEGRILVTIRPNRKAENIQNLINAYYIELVR